MCYKISFPVGGMTALWALKGFLPSVNHSVSTKVRRVHEDFATVSAVEGFEPFRNRFGVDQEPPPRGYST